MPPAEPGGDEAAEQPDEQREATEGDVGVDEGLGRGLGEHDVARAAHDDLDVRGDRGPEQPGRRAEQDEGDRGEQTGGGVGRPPGRLGGCVRGRGALGRRGRPGTGHGPIVPRALVSLPACPCSRCLRPRSGIARRRPGRPRDGRSSGLLLAVLRSLVGCTTVAATHRPHAGVRPGGPSSGGAAPPAAPRVTLPPDDLLRLVPDPSEVPAGLLPVVAGSGPRDLAAVAAFSGDPVAAAAALRAHGFRRAYVAQYAEPVRDGAVLSVVVAEFATLPGAADDLAGDLAASGPGDAVPAAELPGAQGADLRDQPLPGGSGTLTTLRFRVGTRTFLLARGAPASDRPLLVRLGRLVAERARPA